MVTDVSKLVSVRTYRVGYLVHNKRFVLLPAAADNHEVSLRIRPYGREALYCLLCRGK